MILPQYSTEELIRLQREEAYFGEVLKIINDGMRMRGLPIQTVNLLRFGGGGGRD